MDSQPPKPRLREQFQALMRAHHYSIRTKKSYWYSIRFYLRFHQMRHPLEMGPSEVNQFLSWQRAPGGGGHTKSGISLRPHPAPGICRLAQPAAVSSGASEGWAYGYRWRRSLPKDSEVPSMLTGSVVRSDVAIQERLHVPTDRNNKGARRRLCLPQQLSVPDRRAQLS
ncbi:site-specific integrase [Pseudomonas saudiphocaensis]|uniref:site-specific integrase n=1 Tax=Pseudomonas saudiphocaensis TaxID=1499686 RepID=UPI001D12BDDE|nr:site-specific integrase [Pseudomonas saudiphocaensis]